MPKSKIIRVVPDRVFYKLWKAADSNIKIYDYIDIFVSPLSAGRIDFRRKYKMNELQIINMLENIYNAAHLTVKEIINLSGKRKADIGYIFCIPIRTIEDWCSGKNKCPAYIRLMMIRKFGLLSLGKYIYLESDNHIVYNAYKGSRKDDENKKEETDYDSEIELLGELKKYEYGKNSYTSSMKEYEQLHVHYGNSDVQNIIAATDYLKDYMKKR